LQVHLPGETFESVPCAIFKKQVGEEFDRDDLKKLTLEAKRPRTPRLFRPYAERFSYALSYSTGQL
jgi:hypothetical protein